MASTNRPNDVFARVLDESGLSHKRLAWEVRRLASQDGKRLATDHNGVRRWLDGMQPKKDAADYAARALSQRLGRAMTAATLGFTAGAGSAELTLDTVTTGTVEYPVDVEEATAALGIVASDDLNDDNRDALRYWDANASPSIISGFLFDIPQQRGRADGTFEPVDAVAIRRTTEHLTNLDFQLGGGHSRQLLLGYLRSRVLPVLDGLSSSDGNASLYSATAELTQMLGWSAYDTGRHGAAQRYLVHGLRLAREANDHLLGAFVLSSLSHQANYLGHLRDAVQLARAGQHEAASGGSATVESMLLAYEARALASLGDRSGCIRALRGAERAFDGSHPADDPEWLTFYDAAELAGEAAHCFRDLQDASAARQSCAEAVASSATPPRTRAFIGMVSAMAALQAGELDEALGIATEAVGVAGPIDSERYRWYVRNFVRAAAERHPSEHGVAEIVALTEPVTRSSRTT